MINEHRLFAIVDEDGYYLERRGNSVGTEKGIEEPMYDYYIEDIIAIKDMCTTGKVSTAYLESEGSLTLHQLKQAKAENANKLYMESQHGLKSLIVPEKEYAGNLLRAPNGKNFCFSIHDSEEDYKHIHRVRFDDKYATMFTAAEVVLIMQQAMRYIREDLEIVDGIKACAKPENPVDWDFWAMIMAATVMAEGYESKDGETVFGVNELEVVTL